MRRLLLALATPMWMAVGAITTGAIGQTPDSTQTATPEPPDVVRAPVVIDGDPLFLVRGLSTYPAEQRAHAIEKRIQALAASNAAETSVTLEERPDSTRILGNGQLIVAIFDEDAALEAVDRHLLAGTYRVHITQAIAAYRSDRQPAVLWRHALLALGATLAFLVAVYGSYRLIHWMHARVRRRYQTRVHDFRIQSFQVVRADQVWHLLFTALRFVWGLAALVMLYLYLRFVLSLFPWTHGAANQLVTLAVEPLQRMGLAIVGMIPNFVFLAILFVITRSLVKLVRLFFESIAAGTVKLHNFDADWAMPTYKLVRVMLIALAAVVAYPYVPGSESDAFKGISLFIGVVFSLGSSSFVGNLIAGYSMTYRRAFKIGDRVRIGEQAGEVIQTRLMATHLRTHKNEEVIVPNSVVVGAEVVNLSSFAKDRGLILHTTVGIGYQTPWRQVEAMLLEAAARTPGLLREPPPFVLQLELGTFAVHYEINVYCATPERARILYTQLHRNILDLFNEQGVQIMTPAYEGDPKEPKVAPTESWHAVPAASAEPPPTTH